MNVKLTEAQKKKSISSSDTVAPIMQQILKRENKLGRSQEHFWVVGLNNANKILFIELIALGRQNRVMANPPDVFRMAIYKLALKMILVHNHPSGELIPSQADIAITDRLLKSGELLNVDVLDHLIISEKSYMSFADTGIMGRLKKSDSWRVVGKDETELKEMKAEMEIEKATKQTSVAIAKALKLKGVDEKIIKETTKLSLGEIKKL
jgi:DNA repair protein RadC